MAAVYNPWKNPPETGTLQGEFASPELMAEQSAPEVPEAPEPEETMMMQALAVIDQQSQIIKSLTAQLTS